MSAHTVHVIGKGATEIFGKKFALDLCKMTGLTDKEIVSPDSIPRVKEALETNKIRANTVLDSGLKQGISIVKERNGQFIGTALKLDRNGRLSVRTVRQPIPESHSRMVRSRRDLVRAISVCSTVYARIQFGKLKGWYKIPKQSAMEIAGQVQPTDSPKDWKFPSYFGEIKQGCLYLGT